MVMVVALALVAGVVLGLRYKVFALPPASSIWLVATIAFGLAFEHNIWMTIVIVIWSVTWLQLGYLIGRIVLSLSPKNQAPAADRNASVNARRSPVDEALLLHL